jgi:hypothetical protein
VSECGERREGCMIEDAVRRRSLATLVGVIVVKEGAVKEIARSKLNPFHYLSDHYMQ